MNECPEGFEDTLKNWIDEIEGEVENIVTLLDINDVGDLSQIEDAKDAAEDLGSTLY